MKGNKVVVGRVSNISITETKEVFITVDVNTDKTTIEHVLVYATNAVADKSNDNVVEGDLCCIEGYELKTIIHSVCATRIIRMSADKTNSEEV